MYNNVYTIQIVKYKIVHFLIDLLIGHNEYSMFDI